MEPVLLGEIVARQGLVPAACGASCLVCQLRSEVGENSGDMDANLRGGECAWQDPSSDREQCFGMSAVLTKCFYSTRLETRTEESNMCASSRVSNLLAQ